MGTRARRCQFLQFPWRLLMAIAVASSALVALLLSRIRGARLRAIAGLVVVLAHVLPMHEHLKPSGYHEGTRLGIDRPGFRYAGSSPISRVHRERLSP